MSHVALKLSIVKFRGKYCIKYIFQQVTFLRTLRLSLPIYCDCYAVLCSRLWRPWGPKMAQAIHLLLFPIRFKNLSVLSSFPLTATFLQYALTVEPEGINSGQQWQQKRQQKPNGQAWLLPPLDLQCPFLPHPAPLFQPNPCPPAKQGMLEDSKLFTQESHLGFSGRLGGGRGTGSVQCR